MPHYLLAATFLFAAQSMSPAEDFAFRFESFDCQLDSSTRSMEHIVAESPGA
jgi:hypothetical protein